MACLGQNVNISLASLPNERENKTLVIKGMPTEFPDEEFKEILDLNKIQYAKAERMKSRRDGRSLKMFQLQLKDPAEVKALISENLTCHQTGIIFKVEDFQAPISVQQCYNCQDFWTLGQKLSGQNKMCHLWRRPLT